MKLYPLIAAFVLAVLGSCANEPVTSVDPAARPLFLTTTAQDLPLVYDVENTGAAYPRPLFPSFDRLPGILILPDPFRFFGGHVDLSFASWSRRHAEVKASIEDYEVGPKPDPADVDITARVAHGNPGYDTLYVVVTRKSNQQSLTLSSRVYLPVGSGPFPAVIGMNSSSGVGSLPVDIFTSRNIVRVYYRANDVTRYGNKQPTDPYFRLYPELGATGEVGQYSAWAWGVSRLIDGIAIAAQRGDLPVDLHHVAVSGCSYAGKMALFAGALDERVALTVAQESGGGGFPAWRVSHAIEPHGSVEKIDNTNYSWFRDAMRAFSLDNVYKLPHDHHQLMAMVAPRALLATGNTNYVWLSNRAAYVSGLAVRATYEQLGIGDRFGYFIDGGHMHCAIPATQRPVVEAFVDRFLLGLGVDTDVQVYPTTPDFTDLDYQGWMPWAIRLDIAALVGDGTLTPDQGAGLGDKLEAALASIATGRIGPALNQLRAFINQVEAFVRSGALTPEQGAALIAKINSTRTRLGA